MKAKSLEELIVTWTKKANKSGYHGGLSLNSLSQLAKLSPGKVLKVLDSMYKRGLVNPFGCAITRTPIWYMKGVSRDWDSYGGQGFGGNRAGEAMFDYKEARKESMTLAHRYKGKAPNSDGDMTEAELKKVFKTILGKGKDDSVDETT